MRSSYVESDLMRYYFSLFAPAVLSANGDIRIEDQYLKQSPSLKVAHDRYLGLMWGKRKKEEQDLRSILRMITPEVVGEETHNGEGTAEPDR